MKETKIKQRIRNAVAAFFDDEFIEENSIIRAEGKSLSQKFHNSELSEKADKIYRFLKKAFLFLPGVLIMHFASISFALFFSSVGVNLSLRLFWLTAASFMVWAGIGDLKNKKHLLLPLSVIATAMIFTAPFALLPMSSASYYIYFYIGILPLFFIAPILTKGLIDKYETSEN